MARLGVTVCRTLTPLIVLCFLSAMGSWLQPEEAPAVLFRYFDKDSDGMLSAGEFDAAFEEKHVGAADAMDDAQVLLSELSGGGDIDEATFRTFLYTYFGTYCWDTPAWRDLFPDCP